jgi:hypothetical protein
MRSNPDHASPSPILQHGVFTLKGTRLHENSLNPAQEIRVIESLPSTPILMPIVNPKMEESRIAKFLREDKARALREQEFREVHGRVRDAMGTPLPFIVQKLKLLREVQLNESKKRWLGNSYKAAMEAVAKGETSKISLLDASFV